MLRVLLVDDEYMVLDALCNDIRWGALGMEIVATAVNGKQALERCAVYQPDLVVTDITMPVMDGFELMAELSRDFPDIRFAILTAHKDFQYARQALSAGALDYLLKTPMNIEEVEETLLRCKDAVIKHKEVKRRALLGDRLQKEHIWEIRRHMLEQIRRGVFNYPAEAENLIRGGNGRPERAPFFVLCVRLQQRSVLFAQYPESDHSLICFTMNQAIYEIVSERVVGDVLPHINGEAFILVQRPATVSKAEAETQIHGLYHALNQWFRKFLNTTLLCGISPVFPELSMLKQGISQALQTLEIQFYDNRGTLHFHHDYQRVVWRHDTDSDWEILTERLLSQWSMEEIEGRIQGLQSLQAFVREKRPRPSKLKAKIIELLERLALPLTRQEWMQLEYCDTLEHWNAQLEAVLGKLQKPLAGRQANKHPDIQKALSFIHNHLGENLTLQKVAEHIHMNPSYLSHLFKLQTGDNFLDFLTMLRIQKARDYLQRSEFKNYEIAEKVGFTNYPHFCTVFKKITGLTPGEYRRSVRA